jgi:hypothetical protein
MTELTIVRAPIEHDEVRHSWPRRMARVTWIQHKTGLISIAILFAVFAIVLLVTGQAAHHSFGEYVANACGSTTTPHVAKCLAVHDTMAVQYSSGSNFVQLASRAVTLLAAIFLGVPLLSRELESGSYRFAWSQGIGRVRWALLKSTLLGVSLMILTFALSIALQWYLAPFNGVGFTNRWIPGEFDITYLSLPLWAGFAFFLSVLIGAIARKVIPAMASAMAAVAVLVVLAFAYLDKWVLSISALVYRIPVDQGFAPNTGTINSASSTGVAGPRGAWMLNGWITTRSGAVLDKASRASLFILEYLSTPESLLATSDWLLCWTSRLSVDHRCCGRVGRAPSWSRKLRAQRNLIRGRPTRKKTDEGSARHITQSLTPLTRNVKRGCTEPRMTIRAAPGCGSRSRASRLNEKWQSSGLRLLESHCDSHRSWERFDQGVGFR